MTKVFLLIAFLSHGDRVDSYVVDHDLTADDCIAALIKNPALYCQLQN